MTEPARPRLTPRHLTAVDGDVIAETVRHEFGVTVIRDATSTVLWLAGELDISHTDSLRRVAAAALEQAAGEVTIDLSGLQFLDSTGIGTLVDVYRLAHTAGVPIRLRGASERIRRLFQITGLERFFAGVST